MERPAVPWLVAPVLLLLVVARLDPAFAQNQLMYFAVGDSLSLRPPQSITGDITSILWKFNGNLLAEWLFLNGKPNLEYYGGFQDRTTLDKTGNLTIDSMIKADVGVYTVEINNKVQPGGYNVKVVKKVSKPKIVLRPLTCSSESPQCSLSCDGDATEAEPVTYSWKMEDGQWKDSEKDLPITNNEEIQSVKDFTCRMKNPVSEEESEPYNNLFYKEPSSGHGGVVGGILGVLVVGVGVGGGVAYWKREDLKACLCKGEGVNKSAASGGNGQATSETVNLNEQGGAPAV